MIKSRPNKVIKPPKIILTPIICPKMKNARIVAITGSPKGNEDTIVGEINLTE